MKIPCDLILDLLPLYHNNLCSEGSEVIIRKHLEACDYCHQIFAEMVGTIDTPQVEMDVYLRKY